MKREHHENKYDIHPHYSFFFWKECFFCSQEYKREKGWMFCISRTASHMFHNYSCRECCTTSIELEQRIDAWFKDSRPKAPNPPKER